MTTKKKPLRKAKSSKAKPAKPEFKVTAETISVNLVNGVDAGRVRSYLDAKLAESGLVLAGQDTGSALSELGGDSDYEYWLKIDQKYPGPVLLALLEVHYSGDAGAFFKIRRLLDERAIPSEFSSYH